MPLVTLNLWDFLFFLQLLEISALIGSKSQSLAATAVRSEEQMSFVCFRLFFLLLSGVHVARLLLNGARRASEAAPPPSLQTLLTS